MANWYAACTLPGCETKIAEILTRKTIENYCPVVKSVKKNQQRQKKQSVKLCLLPGCLCE